MDDLMKFYHISLKKKQINNQHVCSYVSILRKNTCEDIMKLLSRTEEFILLAVIFLKENGYAVGIRKHLKAVTGKSWSYGALFTSLEQMVRKGYLESYLTEPLAERGGRRKRIYQITDTGKEALYDIKRKEKIMWDSASDELLGDHL